MNVIFDLKDVEVNPKSDTWAGILNVSPEIMEKLAEKLFDNGAMKDSPQVVFTRVLPLLTPLEATALIARVIDAFVNK